MAEIAGIFHWPLSELLALEIGDLLAWHKRALDFWNETNRKGKS